MKAFGFRKVAFASGTMFVGGILATAFADTFGGFIVAYSVIAGDTLFGIQILSILLITTF